MLPSVPIVGDEPIFSWPEDAQLVTRANGSLCFDPVIERHQKRLPRSLEPRETKLFWATEKTGEVLGGLGRPGDLDELRQQMTDELAKDKHDASSPLVAQQNLSYAYIYLRSRTWLRETNPAGFPLVRHANRFALFGGSVDTGFAPEHVHPQLLEGLKMFKRQQYAIW